MNIIIPILYILTILSAILLVGVVLLQKGKDGGMIAMGAGVGEALFGAQVGSFLVKTTIVLGTVFLLSVLVLSVLTSRGYSDAGIMRNYPAPTQSEAPMDNLPF